MTLAPEIKVTSVDREALKRATDVVYGMPYQWLHARGLTSSDTHAEAVALWGIATTRQLIEREHP